MAVTGPRSTGGGAARGVALAALACAACVGVLAVLSTVPFEFTAAPKPMAEAATTAPPYDLLFNVALYVPLGVLAWLTARRLGCSFVLSAGLALLLALVVSATLEAVQQYLPARVSSASDIAANFVGAALGVVLAPAGCAVGRAARARLQDELARRPLATAWKALACALLLIHLRPFDVVLTPSRMARMVRAADPAPLATWRGLAARDARSPGRAPAADAEFALRRARCEYVLDLLAAAAGYALLAAVAAAALRREYGFSAPAAAALAAWSVLFVAGLVIVGRAVMPSRGLDTLHAAAALAGGAVGAWSGGWLRPSGERVGRPHGEWIPVMRVVAALIAGYLVVGELVPFAFRAREATAASSAAPGFNWTPLALHIRGRPNLAALDLSTKWIEYALLAAGLTGASASCRRFGLRVAAVSGGIVGFACLAQWVHLWMPTRHSDVTNVLIALTAAPCGAMAWRWALVQWQAGRAAVATAAGALAWDRGLVEAIVTAGAPPVSASPPRLRLPRSAGRSEPAG